MTPLKLDFNFHLTCWWCTIDSDTYKKRNSRKNFTSPRCCKRESLWRSGNLFRPQDQHGWALKSLPEYNTHISTISLFIGIFFSQLCGRASVCVCVCPDMVESGCGTAVGRAVLWCSVHLALIAAFRRPATLSPHRPLNYTSSDTLLA